MSYGYGNGAPQGGGQRAWTPRPKQGGFTKKPTDRAGIVIGVAVNNIFGNLSLKDIEAVHKDEAKFTALADVTAKVVELQLALMPTAKAGLSE